MNDDRHNDRTGILPDLLEQEALWAQPAPGGADVLLAAIQAEAGSVDGNGSAGGHELSPSRGRSRLLLVAATVVVLVGVLSALLVAGGGGSDEELQAFPLSGTELAPDAAATATVLERPAGTVIELEIEGLPPAAPGTYYEGWVTGPHGSVSAGTFHLRDGAWVSLWSGVDVDAYPMFTVTIQEEGAGPASSGRVMLVGDLTP